MVWRVEGFDGWRVKGLENLRIEELNPGLDTYCQGTRQAARRGTPGRGRRPSRGSSRGRCSPWWRRCRRRHGPAGEEESGEEGKAFG